MVSRYTKKHSNAKHRAIYGKTRSPSEALSVEAELEGGGQGGPGSLDDGILRKKRSKKHVSSKWPQGVTPYQLSGDSE